jgi:glycosyltransferase involved in cell wall biosynthesis
MRVLIVHPRVTFYGGAELVIVKLANYLTKNGIPNSLLTLECCEEVEKNLEGTEIIKPRNPLRFPPSIPFSLTLPFMVSSLNRMLRKHLHDFDIVNVHNFPAEMSCFGCYRKVVWMCNEPPQMYFVSPKISVKFLDMFITRLDKTIVKKFVDCVVVADQFNAERFEKIYGIRPVVIPYGIDFKFFQAADRLKGRELLGLKENEFLILQVGVVSHLKKQFASIKAFELIKSKLKNAKLVFAGEDSSKYAQELKNYVGKSNLEREIIFTGHLPRETIRHLYAACDVLLHPVGPQGGWLSPFEAMCAGAPVVVSDTMTASHIIREKKLGIVTQDLGKAILEIYEHPEKYKRMAAKAKNWVRRNLSWEKFCEKHLEIFEKLVSSS